MKNEILILQKDYKETLNLIIQKIQSVQKQTKICISLLTFCLLIYIISKENERKKAECESHLP